MRTHLRSFLRLFISLLCLWCATEVFAFYNPTTGSWLSRDPSEESGTLNLYEFARNSTVDRFDALGLKPVLAIFDAFNGPRLGYCGDVKWEIWWRVTGATAPGWVVQEITVTWDIKDKNDKPVKPVSVSESLASPLHYWEAWELRHQNDIYPVPKNDDFTWGEEACTKGGQAKRPFIKALFCRRT